MVGMTGLFAAAHPQGAVSLRSTLRRLFFRRSPARRRRRPNPFLHGFSSHHIQP